MHRGDNSGESACIEAHGPGVCFVAWAKSHAHTPRRPSPSIQWEAPGTSKAAIRTGLSRQARRSHFELTLKSALGLAESGVRSVPFGSRSANGSIKARMNRSRGMAQLGSALRSGRRGRRFKSGCPDITTQHRHNAAPSQRSTACESGVRPRAEAAFLRGTRLSTPAGRAKAGRKQGGHRTVPM